MPGTEFQIGRDRAWLEEGQQPLSEAGWSAYLGADIYSLKDGKYQREEPYSVYRPCPPEGPGKPLFYLIDGEPQPAYKPRLTPNGYGYWYPSAFYRRDKEPADGEEKVPTSYADIIAEGIAELKSGARVAVGEAGGALLQSLGRAGATLDFPRAVLTGAALSLGPDLTWKQALERALKGTAPSGLGWGIDQFKYHSPWLAVPATVLGAIFDVATDPITYAVGPVSLFADLTKQVAGREAMRAGAVVLKGMPRAERKAVGAVVAQLASKPGYYATDLARGQGATVDRYLQATTQAILETTSVRDLDTATKTALAMLKQYQAALQPGPRFWGYRLHVPKFNELKTLQSEALRRTKPQPRLRDVTSVSPAMASAWEPLLGAYGMAPEGSQSVAARAVIQRELGLGRQQVFQDPWSAEAADAIRAGVRANTTTYDRAGRDIIGNLNLTSEEQGLVGQYMHLTSHELRTAVGTMGAGERVNIPPELRDRWLLAQVGADDAAVGRIQAQVARVLEAMPDATAEQISKAVTPYLNAADRKILKDSNRIKLAAQRVRGVFEAMYEEATQRIQNIRDRLGEGAVADLHLPHLDDYLPTVGQPIGATDVANVARRAMPGDLGRLFEQATDVNVVIDNLMRAQGSSLMPSQPANIGLLLDEYINGVYAAVVQRDLLTDAVVNSIGVDVRTLARGDLARLQSMGYRRLTVNMADERSEVLAGLEHYIVPGTFVQKLTAREAEFWAGEGITLMSKVARASMEVQGYIAPALLFSRSFMKAQAIEQFFNAAGSMGLKPTRAAAAYRAGLAASKTLALDVADFYDIAKPVGLLSKFDYWAQGHLSRDSGRLASMLSRVFPKATEAEVFAMARKYAREVTDMGITDTGTFGALKEAAQDIHAAQKSGRAMALLRQKGLSPEQMRDLAYRVEVGLENAGRVAAYIFLREEGLPPIAARMGTFRAYVNYGPEARTIVDKVLAIIAWFTRYPIARTQQVLGLGMHEPGLLKTYPILPYWTAKLVAESQGVIGRQTQQGELSGREPLVSGGPYPGAWRVIAGFSRPKWMKMRPDYVAVPWEMLPREVWPTPEIVQGLAAQKKLGQVAYVRHRVPLLEMTGDIIRMATQPASELEERLNPATKFVFDWTTRGFERALEDIPLLDRLTMEPPLPSTPATRIESKLRARQEAQEIHGETPDELMIPASEDPFTQALQKQREAARSYKLFPVAFGEIDLNQASLWDIEDLIRLYEEEGGGPLPLALLKGERTKRLKGLATKHR